MKYRKLRLALMIAGLSTLPFAMTACGSSSSSSAEEITDLDPDPDPDPVTNAFKVDFGLADYQEPEWGDPLTVTAFRPGQASYEYVISDSHSGAAAVMDGYECFWCHEDRTTNPPQVGSSLDEDDPVPAAIATVDITVQAAYDAENFYLKASWDAERPGITHDIWTYTGGTWVRNSVLNEPATAVLAEGEVYSAEDRLALMLMPRSVDLTEGVSFHTAGCFATCHADMDDMPENTVETSKYLYSSASGVYGQGTETDDGVRDGTYQGFPDMWHWRGGRSAIINTATDGFVMESRANDVGPNFYNTNSVDDETATRYMYDADWMAAWIEENFPDYEGETAVNALPAELWDQALENAPTLVAGLNSVAFDEAAANFQEGDILPRRWLDTSVIAPDNSRTDLKAYSGWEDGTWTVIFERALDTGHEDDHAFTFSSSETYTVAFGAHQSQTAHRWHHVTFPVTLGMEGNGSDIQARFNQ